MRHIGSDLVAIAALSLLPAWPLGGASGDIAASQPVPLTFELNQGQTRPEIRYLAHAGSYTLGFTDDAAIFRLPRSTVSMTLAGRTHTRRIVGLNRIAGVSNYLVGADSSQWHIGVPHFDRVRMEGDGVNLVFYAAGPDLEYDLVLQPGVDPNGVRLVFAGARSLRVDHRGNLRIETRDGVLLQHVPHVYQETGGARRPVSSSYVLDGARQVGFRLGAYDASARLYIDPGVTYATFLGGSGTDSVNSISTDPSGNVYAAGETNSPDFPVKAGYQTTQGAAANTLAFVTKINPSIVGSGGLVYSTYLGGQAGTAGKVFATKGLGIAVDRAGNAFVGGQTNAADFPVTASRLAGFVPNSTATTGFISELDPTGARLLYSSCIGGTGTDAVYGVTADNSGKVYLTGVTYSADFPVSNGAYQKTRVGPGVAFVTAIDTTRANSASLLYSTYLGGSGSSHYGIQSIDYGSSIAIDSAGYVYVGGTTGSSNFPITLGAAQQRYPGSANILCGFIAKLDVTGVGTSSLLYSTYLCGSSTYGDAVNAIAVDASGNVYATGTASSSQFPITQSAFQVTNPASPLGQLTYSTGFATELNPAGLGTSDIVYSSYLGASGGATLGNRIAVDRQGMVYVAGQTAVTGFPYTDASGLANKSLGANHAFLAKMNLSLAGKSGLLYLGLFGGSKADGAGALAIDPAGPVWIAGQTPATDFPTLASGVQPVSHATGGTGFLLRYDFGGGTAASNLPTITGVSNAASGQTGVSAGTYISIYGSNFAPAGTADSWSNSLSGRQLPTMLDNVSVTIGGMLAYISVLTPTQINVLAPNIGTGAMQLVVTNTSGTSAPFNVVSQAVQPAFFLYPGSYAVATHLDYSYAVKNGTFNVTTAPAKPGEVIILWGTGFGATNPATPVGQVVPVGSYTVDGVSVAVGGTSAKVYGVALAPGYAGLYQVAIEVPGGLANGDYPVVATLNGTSSSAGVNLTVQN